MFAYFSLYAYFLRTGHRDSASTLHVGRVCPGFTGCDQKVHHGLTFFAAESSFLCGLLLLPLIVKARVQYTYAHQKNNRS